MIQQPKSLKFDVLERPPDYDPLAFENFTYNGSQASAQPVYDKRKYASRYFYHKERKERNQLMSGLLLVDDAVPSALTTRSNLNPPDFDVVLVSGLPVFVEVTEGTTAYESHLTNSISYLRAAFEEWYLSNPAAQARAQGWNVALSIAQPIPATKFDAALEEAQRFLMTENLANYQASGKLPTAPPAYPALRDLGCTTICNPLSPGGFACVHEGARAVAGPWGDAATVWGRIEDKRRKAAQWKDSPLWLVVYVSLPWKVEDTLAVLQPFISGIDPFERVILEAGRRGLMISR